MKVQKYENDFLIDDAYFKEREREWINFKKVLRQQNFLYVSVCSKLIYVCYTMSHDTLLRYNFLNEIEVESPTIRNVSGRCSERFYQIHYLIRNYCSPN